MMKKRFAAKALQVLCIGLFLSLGGCLTAEVSDEIPDDGKSTVGSNSAPQIQGVPSTGVTVGQVYTVVPSASDSDGDPLSFSITNLPNWATFDDTTGELSGQPSLVDEGTYTNIEISVSDGTSSTSLGLFSITVTPASLGSTTLTLTAPSTNTDGTAFTDLASYRVYFGMTPGQYPNTVSINTAGASDVMIENLAPATYYFVATAINTSGIESSFSNEVIRVVN